MKVINIGTALQFPLGISAPMDAFEKLPLFSMERREYDPLMVDIRIGWKLRVYSNKNEGSFVLSAGCVAFTELDSEMEKINISLLGETMKQSMAHYNESLAGASNKLMFFLKREYLVTEDEVSESLPQIQEGIDNWDKWRSSESQLKQA